MPGCSTTELIFRLTEAKCSTIAVFLDISKAYDLTRHRLNKLIEMQVLVELIKVIYSYLAHRSFRDKIDGAVLE